MKKLYVFIFATFFCRALFSCDVLRDMPFEVCGWSPGEGIFEDAENISVSLSFSHEPDHLSVEKNFSLTEDGAVLKGNLVWQDKSFVFAPLSPFERHKDYKIILGAEARTSEGLSLENKFEGTFSTRPVSDRPLVVSIDPQNESVITDVYKKIQIEFSEKITKNSCVNDISFSPSISGSWQIENDERTAVFLVEEPLKNPETYKITIASSFLSAASRSLGKAVLSRWTVGTDTTAPVLEHIYVVAADETEKFALDPYNIDGMNIDNMNRTEHIPENQFFETNDKLKLIFSEPIDVTRLKNSLTIDPSLKYEIETPPQFAETVVVSFSDKPVWGNRHLIKLSAGIRDESGNDSIESYVFRVYANGRNSKPPALAGLRIPENFIIMPFSGDKKTTFTQDDMFDIIVIDVQQYPFDTEKNFSFELYFETAEDARINLFSLREFFRIENTNNAISFSARKIIDSGFTLEYPAESFADLQRVEIQGKITNTNNSGLMKFYIAPGLTDSRLNKNTKAMNIQLNK